MELRRNLNAARRHAHAHATHPHTRRDFGRRRACPEAAAKRLTLCIVLAVLAVLTVAPASAHAITMTKPEKQVLALVNHARATHGLAKLKVVASLERAARSHSRQMVRDGFFSHCSVNGESFASRLIRFGYTTSGCTGWKVGEDIAYGYKSSGTPKAIFKAWMHSAAHRAVILTRRFRNIGVGRAAGTFRGIPGIVFFTLDGGVRTH